MKWLSLRISNAGVVDLKAAWFMLTSLWVREATADYLIEIQFHQKIWHRVSFSFVARDGIGCVAPKKDPIPLIKQGSLLLVAASELRIQIILHLICKTPLMR